MSIKKLAVEFKKANVNYSQIMRVGNVAIFDLRYSDSLLCIIGFDVVVVQSYSPDYDNKFFAQRTGEKWDSIETYPSSEMFGTKGWSFSTLEAANKKMEELEMIQKVVV